MFVCGYPKFNKLHILTYRNLHIYKSKCRNIEIVQLCNTTWWTHYLPGQQTWFTMVCIPMTCGKRLPVMYIPLSTGDKCDMKVKVYYNYINVSTWLSWTILPPWADLLCLRSLSLTPHPTLPLHIIPRCLSLHPQLHISQRITCNTQLTSMLLLAFFPNISPKHAKNVHTFC